MKRIFAALLVALAAIAQAPAGINHGVSSAPARVQKNLVANYGATCDGVTDDTTAFLAFKTAFQGTTPVQLNLPGNCTFTPTSGNNAYPFLGVQDLIVAGNGTATSGMVRLGASNWIFGAKGEYQDNAHSLRTNTANAGDSCVTIKTQPAVTVSAIGPSVAFSSVFTASASGTTLTVTAVTSGTIAAGAVILNSNGTTGGFNTIQAYGTAGTTGVGGTGTYALSVSTSFSLRETRTVPASFTASVDANGVMTVTAVADGTITVGTPVFSASGGIGGSGVNSTGITTVKSQLTGSAGSTGTYQLDNSPANAIVSPVQFQQDGVIRVTLNSTAGLTTGDTIYLSGVAGTGEIPFRANGLKWIKVVNGTQIDLFQFIYDGAYTSGGTGGGDRTSLFSVGSKALMTGWINQAYWAAPYGFPSNPHWFEYKTVTSTNSGTHQVCFDTPLANTYKSTWPQYNTGDQFEVDPGGPATVYLIDPSWELTHVYKDLTLDNTSFQTNARGRNVTFQNVLMTGGACAIPSENETANWISVTGTSCDIELDKIVTTWNISGTTSLFKVVVQSSAMDTINVSGLTTSGGWFGGAKTTTFNNSTLTCSGCTAGLFGLTVGTITYGVSDSTTVTNSFVGSTTLGSGLIGGGGTVSVDNPKSAWSMSGGVITVPNSYSFSGGNNYSETQTRYVVPGHYMFWAGSGGGGTFAQIGRALKITDVTQDVNNTYITTSEAGGFPTGTWTTNGLSLRAHPSPVFTASGLTGNNSAIGFNGCTSLPMYSCQNFTYTGGAAGTTASTYAPVIWGEMSAFTYTNNVPYTNTGALTWSSAQFANWQLLKTDLTTTSFAIQSINAKLPSPCGSCTRTLTPSGATNTQAGDSFTAATAGALFGGSGGGGALFSANTPSDSPQVTIQLLTNQHLP